MKNSELSPGGQTFPTISADGTVTISDSNILIHGDYSRDGDDLVVTGPDGQQLQIVEYFSQPSPPALISSDGKHISGETVELLAGPQAPGQYAQATGGQFGQPIGQVETLEGSASAQRSNGTNVELEVGAPVFQGDVVSAGLLECGADVLVWLRMWQNEEDEEGRPITRGFGVPTTDVEYFKYNVNGNPEGTYLVGEFDEDGHPAAA